MLSHHNEAAYLHPVRIWTDKDAVPIKTDSNTCHACVLVPSEQCKSFLQVRVIGLQYGSWGIHNYGVKPVKVDALDWWPARLNKLRELILAEQPLALSRARPTAFVTFKYVLGSLSTTTGTIAPLEQHSLQRWQITPSIVCMGVCL